MDKKALALLRKSKRHALTEAEMSYCIEKEILWIPQPMTHAALVQEIRSLAAQIPFKKAVNAFLYSISTGDFQYRTALASLLWARALPEHACEKKPCSWDASYSCCVCGGDFSAEDDCTRLNMPQYSRHRFFPESKYMDVSCVGYVLQDLHAFLTLPDVMYCEEDFRILNRIFGLAKEISPTNKVNALLGLITADKSLKLTRADAFSILGVLSACGVFDTPDYKSYMTGFVNWDDQQFEYETDMYYPLNLWRGKHGINYGAISAVLGAEAAKHLTPLTAICGRAEREMPKKKADAISGEMFFSQTQVPSLLDDRMRYYYGLAPIDPAWERVVQCKTVRGSQKHLVLYYERNSIKKMIETTMCNDGKLFSYLESDMDADTNNREFLLPKTSRGREQTLTPSHLQTPTYMLGQLHVFANRIYSFNCSNDQQLPLPPADYEDFDGFPAYTERYIASCPEEYHEVLRNFRTSKRNTIKFTAGDIFRVQLTPNLYTYCLILGKVRRLLKWPELPKEHPFHHVMSQPIMFRQYALVTDNPHMTAEELQAIPLLETKLAQDNEIVWNTYPIVCTKELEERDIAFGCWISGRLQSVAWGLTYHRFENDPCGIFTIPERSESFLCHNGKTGQDHMTCGVGISIRIKNNGLQAGAIPLSLPQNAEVQKKLAAHYGFPEETACDEFAVMFGGLTRKQYIQLAKERFKK